MEFIQILAGLLTPLIAVVTTYIAVQQYRTNRLKFKLELFEKRNAVYQGVKEFIASAVREGNVTHQALARYNAQTTDAFFMFGDKVEKPSVALLVTPM